MRALGLGLSWLLLTACGTGKAIDATQEMPAKMDRMQSQMDEMKHKLTEAVTFEALLNPDFGKDLSPVPFDLMPFAKQFAENADPANIPELYYVWIKKLNEATIDGNGSPEPVDQFNHRKMQTLMALQAVAGFMPRERLLPLLNEQIVHSGRYQTSMLSFLMLRVQFLRDVLLESDLFSTPLDTVGKVEQAIKYADEIEFVARLPYTSLINISITGFAAPLPAFQESLDNGVALQTWRKIRTKAQGAATVGEQDWTGNPGVNQKLAQERKVRLARALNLVDQRIAGWSKKN